MTAKPVRFPWMRWPVRVLGLFGVGLVPFALYHGNNERNFAKNHPAPGKIVTVENAQVHALVAGEGAATPVVMIHGNPGTAGDFQGVIDKLAPTRKAISFDRPGFGWSERSPSLMTPSDQARRLHEAAHALGVRKPIVVGFSFGGPVAISWALDAPDDVSALVLVAAVADPVDGHPMHGAQNLLAVPWLGPAIAWTIGPTEAELEIAHGFDEAFSPEPAQNATVERGLLHYGRPPCLLATARDWKTLAPILPLLAARYGELHLPVEALWSPDDKIVGPSHAEYLRAHVAGINVVALPGAGHEMPVARVDEIVAAIARADARLQSIGSKR
jgi:pimeloyl-ACP methyl ester carboxylesterase